MRMPRRPRRALLGVGLFAAAAACTPVPASTPDAPEATEATADQAKAWYVDKESLLDGELYPGEIDAARPAYRLFATGLTFTSAAAGGSYANLPPGRAIDGDSVTQWADATYQAPSAWLAAKLSGSTSVSSVAVKTGPLSGGAVYDVQTSTDGTTWTTALAGAKNTTWNMETKTFTARSAGWVRLWFRNDATRSQTRFQVFELQAFGGGSTGTPGPTPGPTATPAVGDASRYYPDLRAIAPGRPIISLESGRRLLRFDNTIPNVGNGAFQVRAHNDNGVTHAFQEILDPSGRVLASKFVGDFAFHPQHNHFHLGDVALYQLRRESQTGSLLSQGYKVSFCLLDVTRYGTINNVSASYTTCNQIKQGISRGWADVYQRSLYGQSFDVTNMAAGTYTIVTLTDPVDKFVDANRGNEMAWIKVNIDPARGTLSVVSRSSP